MFWILLGVGLATFLISLFVNMEEFLSHILVTIGIALTVLGLLGAVVCTTIHTISVYDIAAERTVLVNANERARNRFQILLKDLDNNESLEDLTTDQIVVFSYKEEYRSNSGVQLIVKEVESNNAKLQELDLRFEKLKGFKPWIFVE